MNKKEFNEVKFKKDLIKYKNIFFSAVDVANLTLNFTMITTFYRLGEDIRKKGVWREEYVKRISEHFSDDTVIMTEENIKRMCKLSALVTSEEILTLGLFEFKWSELIPYIDSSKNRDEFLGYIQEERTMGEA